MRYFTNDPSYPDPVCKTLNDYWEEIDEDFIIYHRHDGRNFRVDCNLHDLIGDTHIIEISKEDVAKAKLVGNFRFLTNVITNQQ